MLCPWKERKREIGEKDLHFKDLCLKTIYNNIIIIM